MRVVNAHSGCLIDVTLALHRVIGTIMSGVLTRLVVSTSCFRAGLVECCTPTLAWRSNPCRHASQETEKSFQARAPRESGARVDDDADALTHPQTNGHKAPHVYSEDNDDAARINGMHYA